MPEPLEIPSPTSVDRHLLSRFSYGVTADLIADATAAGGAREWFEQQLDPDSIADDAGDAMQSWWPELWWSHGDLADGESDGDFTGYSVQVDFIRWTLLRRIYSKRQVLEALADTWSNLLHVPAPLSKSFPHRMSYDTMIRDHALGRFDDLLVAADTHPAMLCFLDNSKSRADAPNENLGREVLELHTVGHEGGFTEDDVRDSTMIFTGWRVDIHKTWDPFYAPDDHYVGAVNVLGFSHANSAPDGEQVTEDYLRYLAKHPSTADRVCRRLAVRFVSDEPSQELVDHLAAVYLESGTDIRETLRSLVDHPEFAASVGLKVRTPSEDLVNTYRVIGVAIDPPEGIDGEGAQAVLSQSVTIGQRPFDWERPDGFPDVAAAWSSASRMLGSWKVHRNAAAGVFPKIGITYPDTADWLPALPAPFDTVVDEVSRRILARPATAELIAAVGVAADCEPGEEVTSDSGLVVHRFERVINAVLDTPEHMTR